MRSDSVVIIPTYNEKENIENIIRAVFGLEQPFDMLIIDDGSPDGTAAIVKRLMADEFKDRLHLIERTGKLGLGTAYIAGFKWAVAQKYDYVFEMDADFSHNPNDLPRLYAACAQEGVRRGHRVALRERGERGELAHGAHPNVLLRLQIRAHHHGAEDKRHHGRL